MSASQSKLLPLRGETGQLTITRSYRQRFIQMTGRPGRNCLTPQYCSSLETLYVGIIRQIMGVSDRDI
jgi:hypothetical protein